MKTILNIWSVVSFLLTVALVAWISHAYGWRGVLMLLVFCVFIHAVFRKKTGRWMSADGE